MLGRAHRSDLTAAAGCRARTFCTVFLCLFFSSPRIDSPDVRFLLLDLFRLSGYNDRESVYYYQHYNLYGWKYWKKKNAVWRVKSPRNRNNMRKRPKNSSPALVATVKFFIFFFLETRERRLTTTRLYLNIIMTRRRQCRSTVRRVPVSSVCRTARGPWVFVRVGQTNREKTCCRVKKKS